MIDLDIGKLILLALIALVVLGPEKLPVAARTIGAIMRRMHGGWNSVRAEVERELQVADIRQAARDASEQVVSAKAKMAATLLPLRQPLDIQTLNRMMPPPSTADSRPPDSSSQSPLTQAFATPPSGDLPDSGNTSGEVLHDLA